MPRRVRVDELMGAAELGALLGVSPRTIYSWRRRFRGEFPEPIAELHIGLVWLAPDVLRWAHSTGRLPS
jgi:predicted DNA-binding transcriptional regulator AlpA